MKRLATLPEPNPRSGPPTTSEYELVEFEMSLSGQQSVYNAIVRTSESHWRQLATLPVQAPVTPSREPAPVVIVETDDRSLLVLALTVLAIVLWIGVVLLAIAVVKGATA